MFCPLALDIHFWRQYDSIYEGCALENTGNEEALGVIRRSVEINR